MPSKTQSPTAGSPAISASSLAKVPLQGRSQASMNRVLEATEELLQSHLFEELTLQQILERARVSVGAFYARFGSKAALVPCLHERYDAKQSEIIERALAPERWQRFDLHDRVRLMVRYALLVYYRNRGLLRALSLDWRLQPEAITDEHRRHRDHFHGRLIDLLVGDGSEIPHADPRAAAGFGLLMLGAICRDVLLTSSPDHPHPLPSDGLLPSLGEHLTHSLLSSLSQAPAVRR